MITASVTSSLPDRWIESPPRCDRPYARAPDEAIRPRSGRRRAAGTGSHQATEFVEAIERREGALDPGLLVLVEPASVLGDTSQAIGLWSRSMRMRSPADAASRISPRRFRMYGTT